MIRTKKPKVVVKVLAVKELDTEIIKLRKLGKTLREISETVGKNTTYVGDTCTIYLSKPKYFNKKTMEKVIKLYKEGVSYKNIKLQTGWSSHIVDLILRKNNIPKNRTNRELQYKIIKFYYLGCSVKEIAKQTGESENDIKAMTKFFEDIKPKSKVKKNLTELTVKECDDILVSTVKRMCQLFSSDYTAKLMKLSKGQVDYIASK